MDSVPKRSKKRMLALVGTPWAGSAAITGKGNIQRERELEYYRKNPLKK